MNARVLIAICFFLVTATALASSQPKTTSAPLPSTTMATIPPGYTYYPATGSFYKFHKTFVTWYKANATCANEGAHVVVLNDEEEVNIIVDIIQDVNYYSAWTGLRDSRPGGVSDWRTVFGEPISDVFHEWYGGEPTDDARWTCAVIGTYSKQLFAVQCDLDFTYRFVCEVSQ